MAETYNLIFFPTVRPGEDEDLVKQNLAQALKIDQSKVNSWFATGRPTVLLKDVAPDIADRYMQAILECGANCNIQPSGSKSSSPLSLVPKPKDVNLFVCPSCEYEEELSPGDVIEQCPKCDLVLSKWRERQEDERKKEEIRQQLLRDARDRGVQDNDFQRKQDELAELRRLEKEIMKELGIKPPGRLRSLFSARPFSLTASLAIFLVTTTSLINFYVHDFIDRQTSSELANATASEEIQAVAPLMADALGMQQNGNDKLMRELAESTRLLNGDTSDKAELVKAAQQMMKGVGSDAFLKSADNQAAFADSTPGGLGEPAPVPVNLDTMGGIGRIPGAERMSSEQLVGVEPDVETHGADELLAVLGKKLQLPDPSNPNGPDVLVDQIDRLDRSMVVNLMKALSIDTEWDWFLLSQVRVFLRDALPNEAMELIDRIRNTRVKMRALHEVMLHKAEVSGNADIKLEKEQFGTEVDKLRSADLQARAWLDLGRDLGDLGVRDQPSAAIRRVEEMVEDSDDPYVRAVMSGRLAVAFLQVDDSVRARFMFSEAQQDAAKLGDIGRRVAAFSMISRRYYDVRNLTLAGEILAQAQILAATRLKTSDRAKTLGEIAAAQFYIGDEAGAIATINNATVGTARAQLSARLAEWLISEGKLYAAQALVDSIPNRTTRARLAVRLISYALHNDEYQRARALYTQYDFRPGSISDPAERALLLSQYARIANRLGQASEAKQLFRQALALNEKLDGRKAAVVRGVIAIDQTKALLVSEGRTTLEVVTRAFIREPLEAEMTGLERIIGNMLPELMRQKARAG